MVRLWDLKMRAPIGVEQKRADSRKEKNENI